jgi:hypothetical protein
LYRYSLLPDGSVKIFSRNQEDNTPKVGLDKFANPVNPHSLKPPGFDP